MKRFPLLVFVACAACALEAQTYRVEKGIPYSSAAPVCQLDLRVPVGVTNFATVVNLHGGGLTAGRRHFAPWPVERLDHDPVALVAVGYRLFDTDRAANRVRPEDCIDDAAAATAWVIRHIAAYGGDPKKVFLTGQSAGGYLSGMVGMDARWLARQGLACADLAGVIPFTGQMTKHFNVRHIGFQDDDAQFQPKIDAWSPLAYAAAKGLPPICFVLGGRDVEWPCRVEENELLAASLRKCGYPKTEFHETEGDHGGGMLESSYCLRDFVAKTVPSGFAGRFADGERVAFVGDSITHNGGYVAYLQLFQNLRRPGSGTCLMNVGISGDTAGGALKRFTGDVLASRPDRAFVMFGMNDVGRDNWADAAPTPAQTAARARSLAAYARNTANLAGRLRAKGVVTVLMTPSPYDQYSGAPTTNLRTCNEPGLASCAEIVRAVAASNALAAIDLHAPLTALQKAHTNVVFCRDRVHPNGAGHLLMAAYVLKALGYSPYVARSVLDAKTAQAAKIAPGQSRNVRLSAILKRDDGLAFTYAPKALPFPKTAEYEEALAYVPLTEQFNREEIVIRNLPAGRYALSFDGRCVGMFDAEAFARGVNVALLETPNQARAREAATWAARLRELVAQLRYAQLVAKKLLDARIDPNDVQAADAYLDAWLAREAKSRWIGAYEGWVSTYRATRAKRAPMLAEEAFWRERLNAVRPAVSRVEVVRRP